MASLVVIFIACDHRVSMETTVHEDGKIDKTIILEVADTTKNFIGIGPKTGWSMTAEPLEQSNKDKKEEDKKWKVKFEKSFASAQEATKELAAPIDTLFQISSKFERRFKWFYSYLYYADTYHSINRMDYPIDDYITHEDFAFIDRLPAEGAVISKADSLYLNNLHNKIFDVYGLRAIYERHYNINVRLMKEEGLETRWFDTLQKHKEPIFRWLIKNQDVQEDFLYRSMDSLGIPFPIEKMRVRYKELAKYEDAKTDFSNHASEGFYTHVINMPWQIVKTNADSVAGNKLVWKPSSMKFMLKDYTMYAESRRINVWAFMVSLLVIAFTGYLFWRRRING